MNTLALKIIFLYFLKLRKQNFFVYNSSCFDQKGSVSRYNFDDFPVPRTWKGKGPPVQFDDFSVNIFDSLLMWSGQPNLNALEALVKSKSRASASS